jgi:GLPGLI family protein
MIKQKIVFGILASLFLFQSEGQVFISKATIEFEVRSNIKKTMGSGTFAEMLKDQLPQFKTGYYDFTFANNKSIFKFDHWSDETKKIPEWLRTSDEENIWYFDYNSGKISLQKDIYGSNLNIQDTLRRLKWKITNENRIIAGFNCRKAVAIIYDSVYVFAFYTDEIMIPGGPCSINGLPGMILGVTIPRLYTSWIATKVMVNDIDEKIINPISAKKSYDLQFLESTIKDRTKDWYSDDAAENAEIQQQKARALWLSLL